MKNTMGIQRKTDLAVLLIVLSALSLSLPSTAKSLSSEVSGPDSLRVQFEFNSVDVDKWAASNAAPVDSFMKALEEAYLSGRLEGVEITSSSCLIGPHKGAWSIARKRAGNLASFIKGNSGLSGDMVNVSDSDIGWALLASMVEADIRVPGRDEVLRILRDTPVFIKDSNGKIVDGRKKQLMEVAGGDAFRYMKRNFFSSMRYATAHLLLSAPLPESAPVMESMSDSVSALDTFRYEPPVEEPVQEEPEEVLPVETPVDTVSPAPAAPVAVPVEYDPTKVRIKTNIPYWAVVVPNLGVEVRLADHWSLDIPIFYSPFTVKIDYRFRVLALQPGVRYWLRPEMKGHFFGVHLTGGMYNISINDRKRFQDTDGAWGAGIDYGYSLNFNRHWGMEFNIGVGYLWTRYETYYNVENGVSYDSSTLNYFGITRLGISLIYNL